MHRLAVNFCETSKATMSPPPTTLLTTISELQLAESGQSAVIQNSPPDGCKKAAKRFPKLIPHTILKAQIK